MWWEGKRRRPRSSLDGLHLLGPERLDNDKLQPMRVSSSLPLHMVRPKDQDTRFSAWIPEHHPLVVADPIFELGLMLLLLASDRSSSMVFLFFWLFVLVFHFIVTLYRYRRRKEKISASFSFLLFFSHLFGRKGGFSQPSRLSMTYFL